MPRISYVNGRYVHHRDATVHIEDRGYQFSDGVYEVVAFYNRRLLDEALHMKRLRRSLQALQIAQPMSDKAFAVIMREIIARNDRSDGTLYLQVSRGVARRDHPFPKTARPSLVMAVTGPKMPKDKEVKEGVSVITAPDQRWARKDIKSISLLPNILAKQSATAAGAREAWLVNENGIISEGAVSNNAIVNAKHEIITHPADKDILGGITRDVVLTLARKARHTVIERPFSLKEALSAREAFLTSTTANILPVVCIDTKTVGNGKPGAVTMKLLGLYHEHITQETGKTWN
jgi:D-alanine transaminase